MRLVLLPTWPSSCNRCIPIQLVVRYLMIFMWTFKSFCSLLCLLFPYTKVTLIYSYAGYMISNVSLSHRLGGLFCLYCLYETQPFKPPFKIYLSLGTILPETWYWILSNFLYIALVVGVLWRGNIHIAFAWHVMQCWYGNNSHIFQALCQLFGVGYYNDSGKSTSHICTIIPKERVNLELS